MAGLSPHGMDGGAGRPRGTPQEKGELQPIRDPDMAERLRQMRLDGSFGDLELARDLLVARAFTDQIRDHALARGEAFEAGVELLLWAPLSALAEGQQLSHEAGNEFSCGPDLALLNGRHRLLEACGVHGPREVPFGACLEREYPFGFDGNIGQGKDLRRRAQPLDV